MKNRYYFRAKKSPTYNNLAHYLKEYLWKPTKFPIFADFGEKNLDYDETISTQLEYKNRLAELAEEYCPECIPKTYLINDNNFQKILTQIQKEKQIWILKPALLNNGQNILLFDDIDKIKMHYLNTNRMGGEHVLQAYIQNPHLLKGPTDQGHKYSIRMFVVLTNNNGVYLYPDGYFNIAVNPYKLYDIDDLSCHLTNEHLDDSRVNVIQIPTFKYDLFKPLYPKIKAILSKLMMGLKTKYPQIGSSSINSTQKIAIFGIDFLVDEKQEVWLIEANHAPCFPVNPDHDLYHNLYAGFWRALIEQFVLSGNHNNLVTAFEKL